MRRWLAPEILQTSVMDCGPAALQCLLQGHGISVDFQRLREACQVQVDGTSIDQLEEVAQQWGLDAEQVLVPAEHVLRPEHPCLPALAVVLTPSRMLHFVVIWSRVGRRLQLMDPARGRRFVTPEELQSELPPLRVNVAAHEWRAHASSFAFVAPLRARIAELTTRAHAQRMIDRALADPTYFGLAALDAATRAVAQLVQTGALKGAAACAALIERWLTGCRSGEMPIPESYWHALPTEDARDGTAQVALGGALIVRVLGKRAASANHSASPLPAAAQTTRPRVFDLLRSRERRSFWPLIAVAAAAAVAAQLEAILLRGELELGRYLSDPLQQSSAALSVLAFIALVSVLQLSAQFGALGLGRHLEARLRVAFSSKLARLDDRYLHSRPISDLADRSHMVHLIRGLPSFMVNLLTSVLELLCTGAALIWLDPACAGRVAIACMLSLGLPLFALSTLSERDARQRSHAASLAGYYFDALRGATARLR